MRIKRLTKRINQMIKHTVEDGRKQRGVPYITSQPGTGKSSVMAQIAEEKGMRLIDVRLAQLAPEDIRGVPFPDKEDKVTYWFSPNFLPHDTNEKTILFLDELDKCNPAVQNAALQLLLDRKVGDYNVPDTCFMVAAGNRVQDNSYSINLSSALANRLYHLEMDNTVSDWTDWAMNSSIRQEIVGFIQFRPEILYEKELKEGMTAYPTPRTWEFLSHLLDTFGSKDEDVIDAGQMSVGVGAAREFLAYRNVYSGINVKGILSGSEPLQDLTKKSKEASYIYAFICACGFYIKEKGVKIHKDTPKVVMDIMDMVNIEHRAAFCRIISTRRNVDVDLARYDMKRWTRIVKDITDILRDVD